MKSLGEISIKFLNYFGAKTEQRTVNVDDCVFNLGIDRRRMYDIFNVLESLGTI
jgi:hypothetical protein